MKYRTILVDDEPLALQRLERLLKPHEDIVEIVGTADSGLEAVEQIQALKPDLIFLDIQMPELNGFDVLDRIQEIALGAAPGAADSTPSTPLETLYLDAVVIER